MEKPSPDILKSLKKILSFSDEMSSKEFNSSLGALIVTLEGKGIRKRADQRGFFKKLIHLYGLSCNRTSSPRLVELMVKEICCDYFNCYSLEDPQANHLPGDPAELIFSDSQGA